MKRSFDEIQACIIVQVSLTVSHQSKIARSDHEISSLVFLSPFNARYQSVLSRGWSQRGAKQ